MFTAITLAVAAVALAPAGATADVGEPYGGCDEAYAYPHTPGWQWCKDHGLLAPGATGDPIPAQRHCESDETVVRCVWDARHMGDGRGRSYWSDGDDTGGAHFYSHRVIHRLAYGDWRRPGARWLGDSVDLIHGGTREVTRGARISVGDTTYVVWRRMAPHRAPIGTS